MTISTGDRAYGAVAILLAEVAGENMLIALATKIISLPISSTGACTTDQIKIALRELIDARPGLVRRNIAA
jgi:hypothetical protein